jgi:hypothetical protein
MINRFIEEEGSIMAEKLDEKEILSYKELLKFNII